MKKEFKIGDLVSLTVPAILEGHVGLILSISIRDNHNWPHVYWFNLKGIYEENPDWIKRLKRDQ